MILSQEDESVILGSDGLWDVLGNTEAFGLVRDTVKDAMLGAKRLVTEALARGEQATLSYQKPWIKECNDTDGNQQPAVLTRSCFHHRQQR